MAAPPPPPTQRCRSAGHSIPWPRSPPASANRGTWSPEPTSFGVYWQRCTAEGKSCANVGTADHSFPDPTYRPVADDEGKRLRLLVYAVSSAGTAGSVSDVTGVVAATPPAPRVTGFDYIGGLSAVDVHFDQKVYGVDASDFAVICDGDPGQGIRGVSTDGSSTAWHVTYNAHYCDEEAGLEATGVEFIDDDTVVNGAGTPVGGVGLGNGDAQGTSYPGAP